MTKEQRLIRKLIQALLDCDCQFWACEGYSKKPVNMAACGRCRTLYNVFRQNSELKKFADDLET